MTGRSSHVAATAGGVVGCIAFTLLGVVCAFLVLRRRSRRRAGLLSRGGGPEGGAAQLVAEEDLPPPDYKILSPATLRQCTPAHSLPVWPTVLGGSRVLDTRKLRLQLCRP
jgi:hypothetical protein